MSSKKTSSKRNTPSSSKNQKVRERLVESSSPTARLKKVTTAGNVHVASEKESTSAKEVVSVKSTLAQRLTSARLIKKGPSIPERTNLKLVAKAVTHVPVSKITRSSHTNGNHSSDRPDGSRPLRVRGPVLDGPVSGSSAAVSMIAFQTDGDGSGEMLFKVGDKIVYPGHGVGEIEGVKTTTLGGQEHHIYNIKILDSGMKVIVPVSQANAVGLRRIIDKRAIDKVFEILRDRDFKIDTQTWNRRFREYSQKIKTGSVFEIAVVLRDLSVLSADKELSFGEKKMLDMAESLLVSEIALAKSRPQDKVVVELRAIFS